MQILCPQAAFHSQPYFPFAVTYAEKKSNKHLWNFGSRSVRDGDLSGYVC